MSEEIRDNNRIVEYAFSDPFVGRTFTARELIKDLATYEVGTVEYEKTMDLLNWTLQTIEPEKKSPSFTTITGGIN